MRESLAGIRKTAAYSHLLFCLCFATLIFYAEEPPLIWQKVYDSGFHDVAIGIDSDNSGNVYLTGQSGNDFNWDCLVIKYDYLGQTKWVKKYDAGSNELGYAVVADNQEHIYIAGQIFNGANWDFLILKYNSSGDLIWAKTYDWGGTDGAYAIGVDDADNVYVFGQAVIPGLGLNYLTLGLDSQGNKRWQSIYPKGNPAFDSYGLAIDCQVDHGADVYVCGYSGTDILVIKYEASGTKQWAKTYDLGSLEFAQRMTIDSGHNFYLTGMFYNSAAAKWNAFLMKGDGDGIATWITKVDSHHNETGFDVALDSKGAIYVSGTANNGVDDDMLLIKFDPKGKSLWRITYDTGSQNRGFGLTLDPLFNIFVSGYCLHRDYDCLTVSYKQIPFAIEKRPLDRR